MPGKACPRSYNDLKDGKQLTTSPSVRTVDLPFGSEMGVKLGEQFKKLLSDPFKPGIAKDADQRRMFPVVSRLRKLF